MGRAFTRSPLCKVGVLAPAALSLSFLAPVAAAGWLPQADPAAPVLPESELAPPQPALAPRPIRSDVPSYVERGFEMMPMRPLFSFLGAIVDYNDGIVVATKTINESETRIVTLRAGGDVAQVQDVSGRRTVRLARRAEERLGTVFVPLRFVAETLGAEVEHSPRTRRTILRLNGIAGFLQVPSQEYRGPRATRIRFANRVGRALSLRLSGPQQLSLELGTGQSTTRSLRPGLYRYRAASAGMRERQGVRRLLPGRTVTWSWGRK